MKSGGVFDGFYKMFYLVFIEITTSRRSPEPWNHFFFLNREIILMVGPTFQVREISHVFYPDILSNP